MRDGLKEYSKQEPAHLAATIVAIVEAIIMLAVSYGWIVADDSQIALMVTIVGLVAGLVVPLFAGKWVRDNVMPVARYKNALVYVGDDDVGQPVFTPVNEIVSVGREDEAGNVYFLPLDR